jgi:hypothetical protein
MFHVHPLLLFSIADQALFWDRDLNDSVGDSDRDIVLNLRSTGSQTQTWALELVSS